MSELEKVREKKELPMSKDMRFLSDKMCVLSNPGIKLDNLYYSSANSCVEVSECTWNVGRFTQSLQSPNYGSTSQVIIPNQSFIGNTYLYITLAPLPADIAIVRGWGFELIDTISYLFGSSNVSQLTVDGKTNFMTIMNQCESKEKRDFILTQAGQARITAGGADNEACIQLALPWSSSAGLFKKKPFDTSLLRNPITINIKFKNFSAIAGGTGIAIPPDFLSASIFIRQGNLSNKEQSLRMPMLRNPKLIYSYPFIHHESYNGQTFTGSVAPAAPRSFVLQSFINADLLAISVGFLQQTFVNPVGNAVPRPFSFDAISNVRLQFNGLDMYNVPSTFWRLININSELGADSVGNDIISGTTNATFANSPEESYLLVIDFARIRALSYEGMYQNVWRIGNNTMTLRFNTTTANTYIPFVTYYYSGMVVIQNMETKIYFD